MFVFLCVCISPVLNCYVVDLLIAVKPSQEAVSNTFYNYEFCLRSEFPQNIKGGSYSRHFGHVVWLRADSATQSVAIG